MISVYNVRLFNSSPAVVVLIGRLMHGVMSIAPPSLRYKIYVHIRIIVWSSCLSWPVDLTKFSCLLLLPWYTAITGYHMSSDNSNSLQKPMAGYRQMSKSLLDTSQPRKMQSITNGIYVWVTSEVCTYDNTVTTVLCMSSGLHHWHSWLMNCHIMCCLKFSRILWLLSSFVSADYFVIIYVCRQYQLSYRILVLPPM